MNKAVITGIGLVTPLGLGKDKTWINLINGQSAVEPDKNNSGLLSARIKNLSVPDEVRLVSIAFLAAGEAIRDADPKHDTFRNVGCTVSVSKPNLSNNIQFSEKYLQSTVGMQLSRIFKLNGPIQNIVAACATGTNSVIVAAEWIQRGICDVVLAGASESSFHPLYQAGFKQMGVLAKHKPCPFDKKREGFVMGEGAGIFVLERKDKAILRGAKVYGEVSGCAMANDIHNTVAFDSSGEVISRAIKAALKRSAIDTVDYINAHGTATRLNDVIETRAIKKALGPAAHTTPISSTKAATGHLLGASGAVELALCLLAMRDNIIPPTLNLTEPDIECDLDYTPSKARHKLIQHAMSLSFGFGGQIGVIVVSK